MMPVLRIVREVQASCASVGAEWSALLACLEAPVREALPAKVAKRIREVRLARGLSIRQLGARSGLAPEVLSRAERQVTEISLSSLERVCQGLAISPHALLDFSGRMGTAHLPEAEALLGLLAALDEHARARVLKGLEQVVGTLMAEP